MNPSERSKFQGQLTLLEDHIGVSVGADDLADDVGEGLELEILVLDLEVAGDRVEVEPGAAKGVRTLIEKEKKTDDKD